MRVILLALMLLPQSGAAETAIASPHGGLLEKIKTAAVRFAKDEKASLFAFPALISPHGVGPIYGGAVGTRNLVGFATFGGVQTMGFMLREKGLFGDRIFFSFGYATVKEAEFETTYARGFGQKLVVRQVMEGNGCGFRLRGDLIPGRLAATASFASTFAKFVDYKTTEGTVIPIDKRSLKPVTTEMATFGLVGKLVPERLEASASMSSISGRDGQSDLSWTRLGIKAGHRFNRRWSLSFTSRLHMAKVTRESNSSAVDGRCASVADPELQNLCFQLESDLTVFVAQSNIQGTAPPLGGSGGLRSFRELRFKAKNTALSGLEIRYDIPAKAPLQLAAFLEFGHASDGFARLYAHSRRSIGIAARAFHKGIPLRLEAATGDEGPAAFLTAGHAW